MSFRKMPIKEFYLDKLLDEMNFTMAEVRSLSSCGMFIGLCLSLFPFCLVFVSIKFNGDHTTAYKDEVKSGHPQFLGYYRIWKSGVCLSAFLVYPV